jgi:hypothetical protein
MLTRKHFEAFAKQIKAIVQKSNESFATWETTSDIYNIPDYQKGERLAYDALACYNMVVAIAVEDNPNFDETRFRKACGL